jgi:hypothetical protein
VNLQKLGKKLRREATANPKKAMILAIVALVAIYFWAPLIIGWIKPKTDSTMAAPAVTAATSPDQNTENTGKESVATGKIPWPKLDDMMRNDPKTMSAPRLTTTRDPFNSPISEAKEKLLSKQKEADAPILSPDMAGLKLSSTIIGNGRHMAQVNGKTYTAGQIIDVRKGMDKNSVGATFRLVEVYPRRVVLESGGQLFELAIPDPSKSGKIEFVGGEK